ncbi:MAG: hypothetical protein ACI9WU_003752, partial [Myxococcota bacterium]
EKDTTSASIRTSPTPDTKQVGTRPSAAGFTDARTGLTRLSPLPGDYAAQKEALRPADSAQPPALDPDQRAANVEADARAARELGWVIQQRRDGKQPIWEITSGPVDPEKHKGVYGLEAAEAKMRELRMVGGTVGPARQWRILFEYKHWVRDNFIPPSHEAIGRQYAPTRKKGPLAHVGDPVRGLSNVVASLTAPMMLAVNPLALAARAGGALQSNPNTQTSKQQRELERKAQDLGTFNQYMNENHPDVSEPERRRLLRELP